LIEAPMLIDSPVPEMRIRLEVALAGGSALRHHHHDVPHARLARSQDPRRYGQRGNDRRNWNCRRPARAGGKSIRARRILGCELQQSVPDGLPVRVSGIQRLTLFVQPLSKETGG
jgi:hypothetical protein